MLDVTELRGLSKEELTEKEGQLKKQLMQLRFDAKLGKLEKHASIRELRRDIARVLTIRTENANGKVVAPKAPKVAKEPKAEVKAVEIKSAPAKKAAAKKK